MAMIKKAQKGLPLKKKPIVDSVESEMFPGKKIPKSESNYATGRIAKMLEGPKPKKAAPKPAPKKKMKDGGKMTTAKAGKNISAGVAGKGKKAPMVDPKGAYTKVQERTLGNMKKGGKLSKKK